MDQPTRPTDSWSEVAPSRWPASEGSDPIRPVSRSARCCFGNVRTDPGSSSVPSLSPAPRWCGLPSRQATGTEATARPAASTTLPTRRCRRTGPSYSATASRHGAAAPSMRACQRGWCRPGCLTHCPSWYRRRKPESRSFLPAVPSPCHSEHDASGSQRSTTDTPGHLTRAPSTTGAGQHGW